MRRVGFETTAALAVAALDLALVRTLRGAMRAADAAGGKTCPIAAIGPAPNPQIAGSALRRIEPEPRIEPRKRIEPEPRIEPREVIHLTPRIEQKLNECPCDPPPAEPCAKSTNPIQPPWRQLPWDESGATRASAQNDRAKAVLVKRVIQRVDTHGKGGLIDLFL